MVAPKKILNIGCGNDFYGTHRVDKRRTDATTHVVNVEQGLPFKDRFFDEIFERNLMEHLQNVGFHLNECHRVLKKGGTLTLITDNAECMRYYLFGTHTGKYEQKNPGDFHYSIFTLNHLENHLKRAGFTLTAIKFVETDTKGRILDILVRIFFPTITYPRIKVVATK